MKPFEGDRLARRFRAMGAQRVGDGLAVFLIALLYISTHCNYTHILVLTSRFNIKSWTRLIMCAIVCSFPPSPREGCANSIALPSRSRPRASSRLLRYAEAVLRLWASIALVVGWKFAQ
jgi:hypothetical protein